MSNSKKKYTSDHLRGLKVGHDVDDIVAGEDRILVLEDKEILEDGDGDLLVNQELEEIRKSEKYIETKRKRNNEEHPYDGYDPSSKKRNALNIQDDSNDEDHRSTFTIGETAGKKKKEDANEAANVILDSLAERHSLQYMSDYQSVDFKKPKKKSFQPTIRKKLTFNTDGDEDTQENGTESMGLTTDVLDLDRDLELVLNKARSTAIQQQTQQSREEQSNIFVSKEKEGEKLVLSSVAEFLRGVAPQEEKEEERKSDLHTETKTNIETTPLTKQNISTNNQQEQNSSSVENQGFSQLREEVAGIMEEPMVARGMAATLSLLKRKGVVQPASGIVKEQEIMQREKRQMLSMQSRLESAAEKERVPGKKTASTGPASMELDRWRKAKEKILENYTPDVQVDYIDHFGRQLNVKDAWKQLCHRFHGMNPGKKKLEKLLKKVEDDRKVLSPYDTAAAMEQRTKELGTAFISLSGATDDSQLRVEKPTYVPRLKPSSSSSASVVGFVPRALTAKGSGGQSTVGRSSVQAVRGKIQFELGKSTKTNQGK